MDYGKVLKRAWDTTWRYRALWIFGIIIALTTAGGGGSAGGGGGGHRDFPRDGFSWRFDDFSWLEVPSHITNSLIAAGVGLACGIILLAIAATIARYVAETALIRMVDDHEETGERRSVRQGFRMGWSRTTFRLFLINLLISLPAVIVFIPLFLLAAAPLLLWLTERTPIGIIGTVSSTGLFVLLIFLAILVGAVIALLRRFFWRACALEDLGVIDSIRQGWDMVRNHLKDVALMWLIMVGVRIGWAIALIASAIMLFPAILLLIAIAGVVGGLPALLVGGLASLFLEGPAPWILGGVIGIPIFILVVSAPWVFLGGLMEVFKSSTWTLTYRELRALEGIEIGIETEIGMEGEGDEERKAGPVGPAEPEVA
jgi:hypothetical protein